MNRDDTTAFAPLLGEDFIVLTTYRGTGVPVPTTVWFAEDNGTLYIVTGAASGKVRRIREDPRVQVTPSDRVGQTHGLTIAAQARVLAPGSEEATAADRALDQKYGDQRARLHQLGVGQAATSVFLAVTTRREH